MVHCWLSIVWVGIWLRVHLSWEFRLTFVGDSSSSRTLAAFSSSVLAGWHLLATRLCRELCLLCLLATRLRRKLWPHLVPKPWYWRVSWYCGFAEIAGVPTLSHQEKKSYFPTFRLGRWSANFLWHLCGLRRTAILCQVEVNHAFLNAALCHGLMALINVVYRPRNCNANKTHQFVETWFTI